MDLTARPRFAAAGIGVTDLDRSVDFYTRIFGMSKIMKFRTREFKEVVVGFPDRPGTQIALMQYTDGIARDYANTGAKLAFDVIDPADLARRINAEGLEIVREPAPVPELGGVVVGFARDPDGYLIEMIGRRSREVAGQPETP